MSVDQELVRVPLVLLASYGLGCLCAGYYLVRFRLREDVRVYGSGSAGGTNAARRLGAWALPAVFVLDAAKGASATALAIRAGLDGLALGAAMLAVVVGHVLPLQLGLRGGKGVSTSAGALLVADPLVLFHLVWLSIVSVLIFRSRVLGGLVAYAALPLAALVLHRDLSTVVTIALISAVVMAAHMRPKFEPLKEGG